MIAVILSIIIPLRASNDRPYLLERLTILSSFLTMQNNVEYILVDSGSEKTIRENIKNICHNCSFKYLYQNTEKRVFSIGSARDYGVQHAKGKLVTFLDVDLIPVPNFEQGIIDLANKIGIIKNPKQFFTLPCFYLEEEGNKDFINTSSSSRHHIYYQKYLQGDNQYIKNFAPCSSVMVINRHHYLSIGGHRKEFSGHGYEDFELIHRLLVMQDMFPRPDDYYYDSKSWNNPVYVGFRSLFALLGAQALENELFTMHLWHPRSISSGYESSILKNHKNAISFFEKFDTNAINPLPIVDFSQNKKEKVLFLTEPFSNTMECMREVMPYLGEYIFTLEEYYSTKHGEFDSNKFSKFITHSNITLIILPVPYENSLRYDVYQWVKKNKLPFYCFGRGLLPNSWFFDPNGYNVDSYTYSPALWNKVLSKEEEEFVDNYMLNLNKTTLKKIDTNAIAKSILNKKEVSKKIEMRLLYYLVFRIYSFCFYKIYFNNKKIKTISFYKLKISNKINLVFDEKKYNKITIDDFIFKKYLNKISSKSNVLFYSRFLTKKNKVGILMFKFISYPFLNKKKMHKLKKFPHEFFSESKNIFVRKYGEIIGLIVLFSTNK